MASKKKSATKSTPQAERLLEMARKAKTSGGHFAKATGKLALANQSRKATRIG
ncbi:MAG: hypothetical protein ABW278_08460 [Steroidobacteraceae bacterium]